MPATQLPPLEPDEKGRLGQIPENFEAQIKPGIMRDLQGPPAGQIAQLLDDIFSKNVIDESALNESIRSFNEPEQPTTRSTTQEPDATSRRDPQTDEAWKQWQELRAKEDATKTSSTETSAAGEINDEDDEGEYSHDNEDGAEGAESSVSAGQSVQDVGDTDAGESAERSGGDADESSTTEQSQKSEESPKDQEETAKEPSESTEAASDSTEPASATKPGEAQAQEESASDPLNSPAPAAAAGGAGVAGAAAAPDSAPGVMSNPAALPGNALNRDLQNDPVPGASPQPGMPGQPTGVGSTPVAQSTTKASIPGAPGSMKDSAGMGAGSGMAKVGGATAGATGATGATMGAAGGSAAGAAAGTATGAAAATAGKAVSSATKSATTSEAAQAVNAVAGTLAGSDPNSARAKVVNQAANVAKTGADVAQLVASGGLDVRSWWSLLKRNWKVLLALVLIIIIPYCLMFFAIGQALSPRGNDAAQIGISTSSFLSASTYCGEMSDRTTGPRGNTVFLDRVEGKFGEEEDAVAPGVLAPHAKKKGPLAMLGTKRVDGTVNFTNEELKWYSNMRWAFVGTYWSGATDGSSHPQPKNDGRFRKSDIAGKKLMIYNPATQKAVVTIIAEFGPAPWAGSGYNSATSRISTGQPGHINPDQQAVWGAAARLTSPSDYKGVIVGAPTAVVEALGGKSATQHKTVTVGFVDDSTPLGPVNCTAQTTQSGNALAAATGGQPLAVPGTRQGTEGDCGQASVISVVRYYNPRYSDPKFYNATTNSTRDNIACVDPDYINRMSGDAVKDFVRGNSTRRQTPELPVVTFDMVRRSVLAGDPVVIYTSSGSIYNYKHIFVITGWDERTRRFYVMNPFVGGFHSNTMQPNGKDMTPEHLLRFTGDQPGAPYTHAFMIRQRHIGK
jgi:hypothetical protein